MYVTAAADVAPAALSKSKRVLNRFLGGTVILTYLIITSIIYLLTYVIIYVKKKKQIKKNTHTKVMRLYASTRDYSDFRAYFYNNIVLRSSRTTKCSLSAKINNIISPNCDF